MPKLKYFTAKTFLPFSGYSETKIWKGQHRGDVEYQIKKSTNAVVDILKLKEVPVSHFNSLLVKLYLAWEKDAVMDDTELRSIVREYEISEDIFWEILTEDARTAIGQMCASYEDFFGHLDKW